MDNLISFQTIAHTNKLPVGGRVVMEQEYFGQLSKMTSLYNNQNKFFFLQKNYLKWPFSDYNNQNKFSFLQKHEFR